MATRRLALEGFERQVIEVQSAGLMSNRKLLVNGEPAPKGPKRGQMRLTRDDGREVIARWKFSLGGDVLEVDGETIQVSEPYRWWEWMLLALPAGLAAAGIMGWLFAAIPMAIGGALFRSERSPKQKVLLWGGSLIFALALNILLGLSIQALL